MILVSLYYDGGMAAVYRDADGTLLGAGPAKDGGDTASLGGTLLDTLPASVGVGDGRMVVGGLLPHGASRAIVDGKRAVTGNGAWIAIIDAPMGYELAARYEAGDGTIVPPKLPAGWTREPVSDADEPCPACGAVTWERVTPTDVSRGSHGPPGGPMRPSAVIVCTRCGHEVGEGAWYGPSRLTPGALRAPWRGLSALRHRRSRRSMRPGPPAPAIDELDFPVYALVGANPELTGRGWDPEGVHSVTMSDDRAEIKTRALRRAFLDAGEESALALRSVIQDAEPVKWGRGSHAARALRIHAHARAVAARVTRAEPFAVELPVDGEPVRFAGLRDPAGWAAVGDTAEVRIVIAASRIRPDALALRRL
jgi:hypothetical protein